jgi:hypothetical protein
MDKCDLNKGLSFYSVLFHNKCFPELFKHILALKQIFSTGCVHWILYPMYRCGMDTLMGKLCGQEKQKWRKVWLSVGG